MLRKTTDAAASSEYEVVDAAGGVALAVVAVAGGAGRSITSNVYRRPSGPAMAVSAPLLRKHPVSTVTGGFSVREGCCASAEDESSATIAIAPRNVMRDAIARYAPSLVSGHAPFGALASPSNSRFGGACSSPTRPITISALA